MGLVARLSTHGICSTSPWSPLTSTAMVLSLLRHTEQCTALLQSQQACKVGTALNSRGQSYPAAFSPQAAAIASAIASLSGPVWACRIALPGRRAQSREGRKQSDGIRRSAKGGHMRHPELKLNTPPPGVLHELVS